MTSMTFPPDFVWGSATAAHQVEGNNFNADVWALEQAQPSIFREPSGDAVDQWHRFADDVALLAALGLKAYRFSIEWARIEPSEGEFSASALDHYQRCIHACLERGVEPVLTFHHFTAPLWVARKGGMTSGAFPDLFARYCETAARALSGFATACTINELNVPILVRDMVARGIHGPNGAAVKAAAEAALGSSIESSFLFTPAAALLTHGIAAHHKGRDAIKSVRPEVQVGVTLSIQDEQAEPGAEAVRDCRLDEIVNPFLDAVAGDDFIGVQTYTRMVAKPDGTAGPAEGHPTTMMGYEDRPQALAEVCRYVWDRTRTPILVTENGWAGTDDRRRAGFIRESLSALHGAIADGADVRGFFYWSLLDNFEWVAGYGPKFGIVAVDRATQRRSIKPSALVLAEIARANAVTPAEAASPSGSLDGPRLGGAPLGIG